MRYALKHCIFSHLTGQLPFGKAYTEVSTVPNRKGLAFAGYCKEVVGSSTHALAATKIKLKGSQMTSWIKQEPVQAKWIKTDNKHLQS